MENWFFGMEVSAGNSLRLATGYILLQLSWAILSMMLLFVIYQLAGVEMPFDLLKSIISGNPARLDFMTMSQKMSEVPVWIRVTEQVINFLGLFTPVLFAAVAYKQLTPASDA